jgi:hypothetical protein
MNVGSKSSRTDGSAEIDRELISKLFSAGFTIFGIGFSVMAGALVALRDPGISSALAEGLRRLVWLLLPAVVICTAQSLLCLGAVTGFFMKPRWAVYMTFLLIVYMMSSILIWALVSVLG